MGEHEDHVEEEAGPGDPSLRQGPVPSIRHPHDMRQPRCDAETFGSLARTVR